ncbi:putative N-acetylglucosamine-6-phosphate deacetylase [Yarrowia sp. C11]|nr:putative N-acetylglucosamine-6-phosphate deacetylase [Yarrowia sp. C11]KAG5370591.1 putative N-acetylglucosamine-6-phosphate deacetylase [Yarrowia sp. E02]
MSSPASFSFDSMSSRSSYSPNLVKFTNGVLVDDGNEYVQDLWVDLDLGQIVSPDENQSPRVIDLEGNYLSPGFIDLQINGAFGFDFSKIPESSEEYKAGILEMEKTLLLTGTTAYCPTLPSTYAHVYKHVLPLLAPNTSQGADNIGIHVEGPFISPQKPGCHPQDALQNPQSVQHMYETYGSKENLQHVRIITLAPELPNMQQCIPKLKQENPHITVSIGHTTCSYAHAKEAAQGGASMITHLYNAMLQPHHREAGLFGLIKTHECKQPSYGLVVDGIHVHPSYVAIAYHTNPEKCFLVTDAMFAMGLENGIHPWGNQEIEKRGGILTLKGTKTIAGAATTLDECIRNLVHWAQIPLAKALQTVTANPARAIGVTHKGYLRPGCDADLVVLNAAGEIQSVFKGGYQAK